LAESGGQTEATAGDNTPTQRRKVAESLGGKPVCDKALFAEGCAPEEADRQLRANLKETLSELQTALRSRQPSVDFNRLDRRQQETLVDFVYTKGFKGLAPELIAAVLVRDWERFAGEHLYVRYVGHAPDHPRNKAFAQRWGIP